MIETYVGGRARPGKVWGTAVQHWTLDWPGPENMVRHFNQLEGVPEDVCSGDRACDLVGYYI